MNKIRKHSNCFLRNFTVIILLLISNLLFAQKQTIDSATIKKTISFLIEKDRINVDFKDWRKYENSINFEKIYAGNCSPKCEIFQFNVLSSHITYYILLKQGSQIVILDTKSLELDIKSLIRFLRKVNSAKSSDILNLFSKVSDIYQSNIASNHAEKESNSLK
jgi:hypothetical protein